jgi:hypothetical protein
VEKNTTPRNYFLNEQHELKPTETDGGGRLRVFKGINWAAKGQRLHRSLSKARSTIQASPDPMRQSRFFLAVGPEKTLVQPTTAKGAKNNEKTIEPRFADRTDGSSLRRLGLDVLSVASSGEALVHVGAERFDQLSATSARLDSEGAREKALWAALADITTIPASFKVDEAWLGSLSENERVPVVFELQPVLRAVEAELLSREIRRFVAAAGKAFEFDSAGTLFSGRKWYRGKATAHQIKRAAEAFQSIQRIHAPHFTPLSMAARRQPETRAAAAISREQPNSTGFPRIALVDAGVPADHAALASFRQGSYISPDGVAGPLGSHGSLVASRLVFAGLHAGDEATEARCRFYDVNVASVETTNADAPLIDEQNLVTALEAVVASANDVRVFNLSLGARQPLNMESEVDRQEKLSKLSELDNFAMLRDVVLVIAAGNTPSGTIPSPAYPDHVDDPQWVLGHWACAFNALTVGSYVADAHPDGVAAVRGAPSPFSKAGPSPIARAPKPDHSAPGGDSGHDYRGHRGLGVFGINAEGLIEPCAGTSQATPVISHLAARVLATLSAKCPPGTRPSAALLRAVIAIISKPIAVLTPRLAKAAKRTLGRGLPRLNRLTAPDQESALLLWQGTVADTKHWSRVRIPMPREWVDKAKAPQLRLVVGWLSSTNSAYSGWACRKVHSALKASEPTEGDVLHFERIRAHGSYPLIERIYDLKAPEVGSDTSELVLELRYELVHEEPVGIRQFPTDTRVGVVVEFADASEEPLSPHASLQACQLIQTATRLSVPAPGIVIPLTFN